MYKRDKAVFFNSELSFINRTLDLEMKGIRFQYHQCTAVLSLSPAAPTILSVIKGSTLLYITAMPNKLKYL